MKIKQSIRRLLAFGALAALGSCSNFLDKEPLGVVTQDNLFKDPVNAMQTINGVYDVISWDQGPKWGDPSGQYITHMYEWMWGDILSNDAEKGSTPSDFLPVQELKEWTLTPSHGPVGALWTHNFTGVARANTVINNIDAGTIPDDMKQRLKGEALFLRAYFYFYLVRTVGGVPLFENVVLPGDAANVQRSSIAETYAFIEKDLKAAIELLPEKSKLSAAELGRATKGAARGYLARAIMYQIGTVNAANHTWQDVYDLTSTLITSGEYSLGANYAALLQDEQEDGPESLFEIEFLQSAQGYGPIKTGTTSNVFQNNRKTFGYGFNNPTQNLYNEFEANDPRRLVTFIKDGDVVLGIKNTIDSTENATGYLSRKVAILLPINNQSAGQNSRKIRYADILLMKAEAAAYLGKSAEAVMLVNQVRARARMSTKPKGTTEGALTYEPANTPAGALPDLSGSLTGPALLDAIYHERRVELAMESLHYWDMVRTGRYFPVLPAATRANAQKHVTTETSVNPMPLLPIPVAESVTWGLQQNPGY